MQLNSLVPPHYLPEVEQQALLRLGLQPLQFQDWLSIDADFQQFQAHKQQLASTCHHKVYSALPESIAAQEEFAGFLIAHLQTLRQYQFNVRNNELIYLPDQCSWQLAETDLWHCSNWIPEDICLLQQESGEFKLTAASLCSPSNWKLEEKMGLSVAWIHEPVPGYEEELAVRVDRLLQSLKPDKPVLRYNWSIQRGNELCWREDFPATQEGEEYFWRVERQCLIKLPKSGAVIFSIRLFLHSFENMRRACDFDRTLYTIISKQPQELLNYKGIDEEFIELLRNFQYRQKKEAPQ